MKGRFLTLLALAGFLVVSPAPAGDSKGNGGNVVVCNDIRRRPIELYDFYEARELRQIQQELGGPGLDYRARIGIALERVRRLDPERASAWQSEAESWEKDTLFKYGAKLTLLPDSFYLLLPAACRLEQIAIQRDPVVPQDRRYLVNGDFWKRLDEENRAGLVLHEIVYREALRWGHTDSVMARIFNSYITSREIEALQAEGYASFLRSLKFGPQLDTQETP